jgi:tripartite-type tricarboxylate transporter receptor subunit TctC
MASKSITQEQMMSQSSLDPRSADERRQFLKTIGWGAAAWCGIAAGPAAAQQFPSRPLRLVVPFPAGGPTDIVARPLAQLLSVALRQPVIIENKGGAGGAIAADGVAKSSPDGYTLLMGTVGTHAINSALYKKLPYDPMRDFTALGLAASAPVAVVVGAGTPYGNLGALIAAARKQPGEITYASAGNGTPGHLTGEMFAKAAGITLKHVPYRGSAPALTDVVGGQIPLMFDPVQSVLPQIQGGRVRALAVSSRTRSPVLPQVPTIAESGLRNFEAEAWWAVYAPANIPGAESVLLRQEIERVVRSAAFREKLGNLGVSPAGPMKMAFADFNRAELVKWGKAVRDSGASLD